ncbi:cytochrome-b5 reductase [Entomortierella parvispora]|uniref:cytochrome-b5 reductase n=1 Tax=Entomortierella parvispora TaxID=205924 RepID=A0A9P3HKK6_9FUNG|nr:cytochrome-b5 reductase [Entomortierella parvispora]
MVTFVAASALGVGAYVYQWQKHRSGDIFKNPFSSPDTLTNEKWTPILLKKITPVSEHTSLFDFELAHPCSIPISSAIYVKDDEIQAMRAYTPVHSTEAEQSSFQLLIKRYSEGQVSRFMHAARPGQKIEMRGPVVIWPGSQADLEQWDEIGMIAGGTGITAVLPIIHSALTHPTKKIKISLLFAAHCPEELYFKDELDQLAKTYGGRFVVSYAIDKLPAASTGSEVVPWKGHVGFVNADMLKGLLPQPQTETPSEGNPTKSIVLVCGPEVMVKHVAGTRGLSGHEPVRGVLGAMGYQRDQVFRFPN